MDNLPDDPSNQNKGNSTPPPFGSNFNPPQNSTPQPPASSIPNYPNTPNPPNNPNPTNYQYPDHPSIHQEVAQHRLRDAQGHFLPYEYPNHPEPAPSTPPIPEAPKEPSNFKKVISFIIKIKWTKLTLYITGAFAFIYLVISNPAVQNIVNYFFPNSSPILARAISLQGRLKSSDSGIYSLVLPNQEAYILHFKPSSGLTNLKKLDEVVVKGNLTWTPYIIENAEVYPLNISTP